MSVFCPFFARPMTIRQDSRIGRTHVRPKGELHGWSESKDERKGSPVTPPFGFVCSLEKSGPRLNFFRTEEIDAPKVRPKGEGQGCPESNSLRFTSLRQGPLFPWIFLHSLTGFRGGLKEISIHLEISSYSQI